MFSLNVQNELLLPHICVMNQVLRWTKRSQLFKSFYLVEVSREREVWASPLRPLPPRPDPGYAGEDG